MQWRRTDVTGMVLASKPVTVLGTAIIADCLHTTLSSCEAHLSMVFQISNRATYRICQRKKWIANGAPAPIAHFLRFHEMLSTQKTKNLKQIGYPRTCDSSITMLGTYSL